MKKVNYSKVDQFIKGNPQSSFTAFHNVHPGVKISNVSFYKRQMLIEEGRTYPSAAKRGEKAPESVSKSTTQSKTAKQIVEELAPRSKFRKQYIQIIESWVKDPDLNLKAINKLGIRINRTGYQYLHKRYFEYIGKTGSGSIEPKQRRRNLQYTEVAFIKEVKDERELIIQLLESINSLMKANLQLVEVTYPEKGYEIRHYSR